MSKSIEDIMKDAKLLKDKGEMAMKHAKEQGNADMEREAQAYLDQMSRLLAKYRIDQSELDFQEEVDAVEAIEVTEIDWREHGVKRTKRRQWWIETIAKIITSHHGCQALPVQKSNRILIIGRKSSAQICEYVIAVLVRACAKLATSEYDKAWNYHKKEGTLWAISGFKEGFLKGFIIRIDERLKETQKGMTTAITLFNKDLEQAKEFVQNMPGLVKSRVRQPNEEVNAIGYNKGRETADKMQIGANAFEGSTERPRTPQQISG